MIERLLIVEDESIVQLHLKKIVQGLGYRVSGVAASKAAALESAAVERPDLVLMDVRLEGDDDGIETAEELRRRHGLPVVFLTAYADEATLERARQLEPVGYIVKPFTEQDVQATLTTALAKHRAESQVKAHGQWLTTILESLAEGVLVTDGDGCLTFVNGAAQAFLGLPPEALVGQGLLSLCSFRHRGQTTAFEDMMMAALRQGRQGSLGDAELIGGGAGERAVELTAAPLMEGEGKGAGMVLIVRDVSERKEAEEKLADLRRLLGESSQFHGMVGRSPVMDRVFQLVREVASVEWTALIEGETGTGKELVARALHAESSRASGPFVPVNTAGLTESLLASQLFGHRKGAFTGALTDQRGLFEAASGGTLFLDEIGDIPPAVQTSLLRILEDKAVTPVGATQPRKVDVRFVAATHRNLVKEVEEGRFRADLLYRLRVARIELPPLRDRGKDLELLSSWFLERASAASGKPVQQISDGAWRLLRAYRWPGNVRELRSAIEYSVIRCRGSVIQAGDLPPELATSLDADPRQAIVDALQACGGNRTAAARHLGISRATFYRRLTELGLDAPGP